MPQLIHNEFMKRNTLQDLFRDHYEEIQYTLHPRKTEMENIDKMINCGDPAYGGAMYGCPDCGTLKFVPFRCHSRFCPTCGAMYSQKRAQAMSFKLINCQHRHCVFTISKELRHYFLEDRDLLNCLFEATSSVINRMFYKINKSQNCTHGYILVLHTFGRPVIGLSRIDSYDKEHDTVTFHYNRHEDEVLVTETIPSMEFIKRLIQHIPEKDFKMIRYYGVYGRHRESDKKLYRLIHPSKKPFFKSFLQWHSGILSAFGYDPLSCPKCNSTMKFLELRFNHKRVSLEDLYEKAMGKCRPKSRAPSTKIGIVPSYSCA